MIHRASMIRAACRSYLPLLLILMAHSSHGAEADVQWLLNFDGHEANTPVTTYVASAEHGEVAPSGPVEAIRLTGVEAPAIQQHRGRTVLFLDGQHPDGGTGLKVTHPIAADQSRIIEAVIAPRPNFATRSDWSCIYSNNDAPFTGGNMELRLLSGNRQAMLAARTAAGHYTQFGSDFEGGIPVDGTFTHVAAVYDAERRAFHLYVNGMLQESRWDLSLSEGRVTAERVIGRSNSFPGSAYTGTIDAVAESTFTGPFEPGMFALIDAAGPAPERKAADAMRMVSLEIPDDILELPKAPSTRHRVHWPQDWSDLTYHHGAIVTPWKGRLYVAWHGCSRDEHTPPYLTLVSRSNDMSLESFSEPQLIGLGQDEERYLDYMRKRFNHPEERRYVVNTCGRLLHATESRLYLYCLAWTQPADKRYDLGEKDWVGRVFFTEDGDRWEEIPPEKLDELEAHQGFAIRTTSSNHQFTRLRDGRLMAYNLASTGLWCPTTTDPTGLTGWDGGIINSVDCADVGEPGGWEGPDGVLHGTARWGTRIWHSYSEDGGKTWTRLAQQPDFPDCPGNKDFGQLPDKAVFYVGNPVPGSRKELVLGISRDGWTFDDNYLIRWEPVRQLYPAPFKGEEAGYQYPDAVYHDGYLYAAYSVARDGIEVSKVDLSGILSDR